MKYPGGTNSSQFFYEQVREVSSLYEQWNDCERTVVLYALLKRLPFSNLKFLQLYIDYNLTQNYNTDVQKKFQTLESNSNNALYLEKILHIYKNLKTTLNGCSNGNTKLLSSKTTLLTTNTTTTTTTTPTTVCNNNNNNNCSNNNVVNNNNNISNVNNNLKNSNKDLNQEFESADILEQNIEQYYNSKEDILNDILIHLPLLKPGNDEAKSIYLSLVPIAIDDSVRQIVPTESVQQILSYLLIHPAITNEDRRSLGQWLRHLEDHISSSYIITPKSTMTKLQNTNKNCGGVVVGAVAAATAAVAAVAAISPTSTNSSSNNNVNNINNNSTSCSLSSTSSIPSSLSTASWQTVAPPTTIKTDESPWDLKNIKVTKEYCDEVGVAVSNIKLNSQKTTSQSTVTTAVTGGMTSPVSYESNNDDHHISFSKNGTEILDYDFDDMINDKSNTQIAIPTLDTIKQFNEFLNVPNYLEMLDANINTTQKTRRSNSLTTTPSSQTSSTNYSLLLSNHCNDQNTNIQYLSTENLAAIQKPRSFSLTIESPRSSLTSSGSDTRLDDFNKQHYLGKFNPNGGNNIHVNYNSNYNNVGMHNIGQWLKSLRLHKYVWLFTNLTYEEMLNMSEEHLQNLGVTKGARNKLILCIQKLHDRLNLLKKIEIDLLKSTPNCIGGGLQFSMNVMLEELTNVVLTPMKPIDYVGSGNSKNDDVARQFVKVLDCICTLVINKPIGTHDEESVNVLLWILEKALHNEAFVVQLNQLKEHKYKLSKIKMQFTPKNHYCKNQNGNGNLNKPRWNSNNSKHPNSNKQIESQQQQQQQSKSHRKNSTNSIPYFSTPTTASVTSTAATPSSLASSNHLMQQQQLSSYYQTNNNNSNSTNNYNKSSSYPNFSSSNNSSNNNSNNTNNLNNTNNSSNNISLNSITNFQLQSQHQQQQLQQQCAPQYHRHSLHNLINLSSCTTTSNSSTSSASSGTMGCGGNGGGPLNALNLNKITTNNNRENIINRNFLDEDNKIKNNCINMMANTESMTNKNINSIGEINSRLEFLCLQMTEQAIN